MLEMLNKYTVWVSITTMHKKVFPGETEVEAVWGSERQLGEKQVGCHRQMQTD